MGYVVGIVMIGVWILALHLAIDGYVLGYVVIFGSAILALGFLPQGGGGW